MKKLLCWLFGHLPYRPYNRNFFDPYCPRCGKHFPIKQIYKDAKE